MDRITEARKVIEDGGLVIYPTETAYGIAVDALNPEAIDKVFEAKKRPRSKGLTVIVKDLAQAEKYAELTEDEKKIVEKFMPGPITLVVDKKPMVPDNLNEKFVFRISSSETARKLAENGPVTATSANISGNPTSYSVDDIAPELREKADYILDEGRLDDGPTSTIAEVKNGEVIIHRRGPVSKQELEDELI